MSGEIPVGKTVARIETAPVGEYGPDYSRVLIHFTDGTALSITGSSYEEVSQTTDDLDHSEVLALQRLAQGHREVQRVKRLNREVYDALPQEEKDRREAERRANMGPFARAMEDEIRASAASMFADFNLPMFGSTIVIPKKRSRARRS